MLLIAKQHSLFRVVVLTGILMLVVLAQSGCTSPPSTSLEVQEALRPEFAKDGITLTWLKEENVSIWGGFNESIQLSRGDEIVASEFEMHEFDDAEQATFAADNVNPEGDHIQWFTGTYWVGRSIDSNLPLHFFMTGKVIAIYYGDDQEIIDTFQKVMGMQFAGA